MHWTAETASLSTGTEALSEVHGEPADFVGLQAIRVVLSKTDDGTGDRGESIVGHGARNENDANVRESLLKELRGQRHEVSLILRDDAAALNSSPGEDIVIGSTFGAPFMGADNIDTFLSDHLCDDLGEHFVEEEPDHCAAGLVNGYFS